MLIKGWIKVVVRARRHAAGRSRIENALRDLACRDHGTPVGYLESAIRRPDGDTGQQLAALVEPTNLLPDDWTVKQRAGAVWRLIDEGIEDPTVGPAPNSRKWRVLNAAFRRNDPDIDSWKGSLNKRFYQLKETEAIAEVFNNPRSLYPIDEAWRRAVAELALYVEDRFSELNSPELWQSLRSRAARFQRDPDSDANPVYIEYLMTTVFLKKQLFHRRVTERLITAMEENVSQYIMHGRPPLTGKLPTSRVTTAWGCELQHIEPKRYSDVVGRLTFDPISKGKQHWIGAEAVATRAKDDRPWVAIRVTGYGIAEGRRADNGVPVSGLTVRVVFDGAHLPVDVWAYTDRGGQTRPPAADSELRLAIRNNMASYTFPDELGPGDEVGIGFSWE